MSGTTSPAGPAVFAMVGSGWRAQFFRRVAEALPDSFHIGRVVVRDPARRTAVGRAWGVATASSVEDLLADAGDLDFVVSAVPWPIAPDVIRSCALKGVPLLSETPPAPTADDLVALYDDVGPGALVEVAEEYPHRPMVTAIRSLARSGRLGTVHHAQVSIGHGYHGVAVLRHLLALPRTATRLTAHRFVAPVVAPPGRDGPADDPGPVADEQLLAVLDVGDSRSGVLDFAMSQYFSPVRRTRLLVRGERGEVDGPTVRWAVDQREAFEAPLVRDEAGVGDDLRGRFLARITLAGEVVWRNPTAPARLSDDEVAVAEVLTRMAARVRGGPASYPLADACHDHDLGLAVAEAAGRGEAVLTPARPWHD